MLKVASMKKQWVDRDLYNEVIQEINLPEKLATLRYSSKYHDLVAYNRVGWALTDRKLAGLLTSPKLSN